MIQDVEKSFRGTRASEICN